MNDIPKYVQDWLDLPVDSIDHKEIVDEMFDTFYKELIANGMPLKYDKDELYKRFAIFVYDHSSE